MTKRNRKPDAADRIAAREYPIDKWSTGEEVLYNTIRRAPLARRIRRAINAAELRGYRRCLADGEFLAEDRKRRKR